MSQELQTQTQTIPAEWKKMYDRGFQNGYQNGLRAGMTRGTKAAPDLEYQRERDERMYSLFAKALARDPILPDIKIDLPEPAPVTINNIDPVTSEKAATLDALYASLRHGELYRWDAKQGSLVVVEDEPRSRRGL